MTEVISKVRSGDHDPEHISTVSLYFAYYNFCRVHSSLRVTPAMEAQLTDHVWTIAELLA